MSFSGMPGSSGTALSAANRQRGYFRTQCRKNASVLSYGNMVLSKS